MRRRTSPALLVLFLLVSSVGLVWRASTPAQRRGYLDWIGLHGASNPEGTGAKTPVTGPKLSLADIKGPDQWQLVQPVLPASGDRSDRGLGDPCFAGGAANPTHKTQQSIYRSTDDNGRAVFSDRQPGAEDAKVVGSTAGGGLDMFSIDYQFLGNPPADELRPELQKDIAGVFRFIGRTLGVRSAEPVHVNLAVIDGLGRFKRYRDEKARSLHTTSGFYSFNGNEAVVRWMGTEATLAVTRHEVAHLALGNWLGNTPIWLNEGIAELVERLHFRQSFAASDAPRRELDTLRRLERQGSLPTLRRFLALDRSDWDRMPDEVTYTYAWSLVHVLLSDPRRRSIATDYLNTLAEHRCRPFDHVGWLDRHYPGGIDGLGHDWTAFVAEDNPQPLTF